MNLLKSIAQVIVQRAGYSLPNEATGGLKGLTGNAFKNLLAQRATGQSLAMPSPPTPPADSNDEEAQKVYNEALLAYNQQFQAYHTSMVGTLLQRIQMMQQQMFIQQQRNASSQTSSANSSSGQYSSALGVGGILDSSADI